MPVDSCVRFMVKYVGGTYVAQNDCLHLSHTAGVLPAVSKLSATNASRLGLLHLSAAHRWSLCTDVEAVGLSSVCRVVQACISGEIWSLQNNLSHLHRIGRKSLTLQVSRAQ